MPSFLQSVRVRTLLILLAVVAAALLGQGLWAQRVLRESFGRLEAAEAVETLQLAQQVFHERCQALAAAAVDWARSAPVETAAGTPLPAQAVLLCEVRLGPDGAEPGRLALAEQGLVAHLPALLARLADPARAPGGSGRALAVIDGRLLLTVWTGLVRPDGPPTAALAGTWLDQAWATRIGDTLHHRAGLQLLAALPPDAPGRQALAGPHALFLQQVDEDELLGHVRIDLDGGPLVLTLSLDRGIVAAGGLTWGILMSAIMVTGVILVTTMILVLEATVLARLTRLGHRLSEIAQTNDQKSLVDESGADEVGRIGSEINRLLASQRGWREQISRRNVSMRLIFDTLPIGLLSLDEQGRIQPDRSSATGELLGRHDLDGLDLGELLAPGPAGTITRRRLADFLTLVRAGTLDAEELEMVNPMRAVTVQGAHGPHVLRLQFYNMEQGHTTRRLRRDQPGREEVSGVLVTISDISDEQRLAAEAERSQSDYQQLKAMAEDVELFHGFVLRTRTLVKQLNELSSRMGAAPDRVQLNDLQRTVRALRQGAAIFELAGLEKIAAGFDAELKRYLAMANLSDAEVRRCRYGVADLEAGVIAVERQFRTLLGREEQEAVSAPTPRGAAVAAPRTQEELRVAKRSALVRLTGLVAAPARSGLAATIRTVVPMARRRGVEVRFTVVGEEVPVDQAYQDVLNQVLPHLVRFACDHGFDTAEARVRSGKPPLPALTLTVERRERTQIITVADDGQGIDPARMRTLAVAQQQLSEAEAAAIDDQAAQALVFSLELDNGDDSLSGVRPVAFGLIIQRLYEELNAEVAVASVLGQGTAVMITIPLPMS